MASSDLPANNKDAEQIPKHFPPVTTAETGSKPSKDPSMSPESDPRNSQTVKSTPPSSGNNTESASKPKRESPAANTNNNNKETESSRDTPEEKQVPSTETAGVKDVEMKDAESIDVSTKEVEMQDAEVVHNETDATEKSIKEGETHTDIDNDYKGRNSNAPGGCKQDQGVQETEKSTKVETSESNEKQSMIGSGQHALGEVATLLKQVQESDEKARLEVEVKVKNLDHENE